MAQKMKKPKPAFKKVAVKKRRPARKPDALDKSIEKFLTGSSDAQSESLLAAISDVLADVKEPRVVLAKLRRLIKLKLKKDAK